MAAHSTYWDNLRLYEKLEVTLLRFDWLGSLTFNGRRLVTANGITWARFLLLIPAAVVLLQQQYLLSAFLMLISYWGDHLDGLFARTQGDTTPGGAYLDRTLDKVGNIGMKLFYCMILPLIIVDNPLIYSEPFVMCAAVYSIVFELTAFIIGLKHWFADRHAGYPGKDANKSEGVGKVKMFIDSLLIMTSPLTAFIPGNSSLHLATSVVFLGGYVLVAQLSILSLRKHSATMHSTLAQHKKQNAPTLGPE